MRNTITIETRKLNDNVTLAWFANVRNLHAAESISDAEVHALARETNANAMLDPEEGIETLADCFRAIEFGWAY